MLWDLQTINDFKEGGPPPYYLVYMYPALY
jgi:hypothetical protein